MIKNIDQLINDLFASFNSRQVRVVSGRFGLKTGEKTTLQEIGDELEITRERVRQIEEQIIKKLVPKIQERVGEFLEFSNKHLLDLGGVRKDDNFIDDLKYFFKARRNDQTLRQ